MPRNESDLTRARVSTAAAAAVGRRSIADGAVSDGGVGGEEFGGRFQVRIISAEDNVNDATSEREINCCHGSILSSYQISERANLSKKSCS